MNFLLYIILLVFLAYLLPGLISVTATTGGIWGEGFLQVAKWSIYSLEASAFLMCIAVIHFLLVKAPLGKLLSPFYFLLVGFLILPLNAGFFSSASGLIDTAQSDDYIGNVNNMLSGFADVIFRHGTGVLGVISAFYSICLIFDNKPKNGFLKKLFKF